jgi:enoyl-CoA hydratase/carnithine racemase
VSGSEAAQLGLATQVSDSPLDAALEMAREIAGRSPHAVRATKQLFNETRLGSIEDGFKLEEKLQMSLIGGANQIEAVRANMQKRQPDFSDPE